MRTKSLKVILNSIRREATALEISRNNSRVSEVMGWLVETLNNIEFNSDDYTASEFTSRCRTGLESIRYAFNLLASNQSDEATEYAVELLEEVIINDLHLMSIGC